jgi:hypothetical protein
MPGFIPLQHHTEPDVEFFRLHNARPDGVVVARYRDHAVCDVMIDEYGQRYVFAGLAPRRRDGTYDVKGLKVGEVILEPGLIYQLIPVKARRFT